MSFRLSQFWHRLTQSSIANTDIFWFDSPEGGHPKKVTWLTIKNAIIAGSEVVDDLTPQLGGSLDTNSFQVKWSKGADVIAASELPVLVDGNYFDVSGATGIATIAEMGIGTVILLHFDAGPLLTHSADLVLPGAANITAAAGDEAIFVQYATGDWRCALYFPATGLPYGITANLAELNYLDLAALGTGAASKAVVLDTGEDFVWPSGGILTLRNRTGVDMGTY